jgi:hypothetical protein
VSVISGHGLSEVADVGNADRGKMSWPAMTEGDRLMAAWAGSWRARSTSSIQSVGVRRAGRGTILVSSKWATPNNAGVCSMGGGNDSATQRDLSLGRPPDPLFSWVQDPLGRRRRHLQPGCGAGGGPLSGGTAEWSHIRENASGNFSVMPQHSHGAVLFNKYAKQHAARAAISPFGEVRLPQSRTVRAPSPLARLA